MAYRSRNYLFATESLADALRQRHASIAELPKAKSLSVMLSIEGKAALAYWTAWRDLSISWKSQNRYPFPDEWKTFLARSSLLSGEDRDNRRATNPINAMLNYAYAVLLTEMRIKAIADGFDPTIGIVHDRRIRPLAHKLSGEHPNS
jgi:CRISPR-associated protein Cas1